MNLLELLGPVGPALLLVLALQGAILCERLALYWGLGWQSGLGLLHPASPALAAVGQRVREVAATSPATAGEWGWIQLEAHAEALKKFLGLLKLLAALSPLLGLLGTILGLIEAFGRIQASQAAVSPALIAGGIQEALYTTVAGICLAMVGLLLHGMLLAHVQTQVRSLGRELDLFLLEPK